MAPLFFGGRDGDRGDDVRRADRPRVRGPAPERRRSPAASKRSPRTDVMISTRTGSTPTWKNTSGSVKSSGFTTATGAPNAASALSKLRAFVELRPDPEDQVLRVNGVPCGPSRRIRPPRDIRRRPRSSFGTDLGSRKLSHSSDCMPYLNAAPASPSPDCRRKTPPASV